MIPTSFVGGVRMVEAWATGACTAKATHTEATAMTAAIT